MQVTYVENSASKRISFIKPKLPFEGKHGHCVWCGKKLTGRQRTWCADKKKCLAEYMAKCGSWQQMRVWMAHRNRERHNGILVCEKCNEHIKSNRKEMNLLRNRWEALNEQRYKKELIGIEKIEAEIETIRVKLSVLQKHTYEIDHKVAIALGGHPTDVNNLWLICIKCHKQKTREDRKEIASQKQFIKEDRLRLKQEERLNSAFGNKSKWASLQDFQGVKNATE